VDKPLVYLQNEIQIDLVQNIVDFVLDNHPNIGIGADFDGYRGLDTDGVGTVACTLVLHPEMKRGIVRVLRDFKTQKAEQNEHAGRISQIVEKSRVSYDVRPNSVCLYSLSKNISTRIIQNIKRYNTPLERVEPILETLFPFGSNVSSFNESKRHLNPLPPFGQINLNWIKNDEEFIKQILEEQANQKLNEDNKPNDPAEDKPDDSAAEKPEPPEEPSEPEQQSTKKSDPEPSPEGSIGDDS